MHHFPSQVVQPDLRGRRAELLKTDLSKYPGSICKSSTESEVHTGLQSQFSFWPCTTWLEVVYFLQMSLSNRLLRPGMSLNSANILWTCSNSKQEAEEQTILVNNDTPV